MTNLNNEDKATTQIIFQAAIYASGQEDAFTTFDIASELKMGDDAARQIVNGLIDRKVIHPAGDDRWAFNEHADMTQFVGKKDDPTSSEVESPPNIASRTEKVRVPLRVIQAWNGADVEVAENERKVGIQRTKGFEKKKLALYAVNTGSKCGVGCKYCSTSSMMRTQPIFKDIGRTSFEDGYAVVDPGIVERVKRDAKEIPLHHRGKALLSSIVDPWATEALEMKLGRRCVDALLAEPGWNVRVLTKSIAARDSFDIIERCPERVQFGMSITAMPDKEDLVSVIEVNAAPISKRMDLMREAADRGFRNYGMFCPLLPGIGDQPDQVRGLIEFSNEIGAEETFVENLNGRGPTTIHSRDAMAAAGHTELAAALDSIRHKDGFSDYVLQLVQTTQAAMRELSDIRKLRFLLYTNGLRADVVEEIRRDPEGIVFLNDDHDEEVIATNELYAPDKKLILPWSSQQPVRETMRLSRITADFKFQCRTSADADLVREYASDLEKGAVFPPVTVFREGSEIILGDGFHRYWATQFTGRREIEVNVFEGGKAQALAYAAGANASHGMRRTNGDKRRAVTKLLSDLHMGDRTDRAIAELAGVDHKTVSKVRLELNRSGEIPHFEERIGADGRVVKVEAPAARVEPHAGDANRTVADNYVDNASVQLGVDVPEDFEKSYSAIRLMTDGVTTLSQVDDADVGVGYRTDSLIDLANRLREVADRIEKLMSGRPDEVPDREMELVMALQLKRFFSSWQQPQRIVSPPTKQDDGTWICRVGSGDGTQLSFDEQKNRWVPNEA